LTFIKFSSIINTIHNKLLRVIYFKMNIIGRYKFDVLHKRIKKVQKSIEIKGPFRRNPYEKSIIMHYLSFFIHFSFLRDYDIRLNGKK